MKGKASKKSKATNMPYVSRRDDYGKTDVMILNSFTRDRDGLSFREASKELGINLDNFHESTRLNEEGL